THSSRPMLMILQESWLQGSPSFQIQSQPIHLPVDVRIVDLLASPDGRSIAWLLITKSSRTWLDSLTHVVSSRQKLDWGIALYVSRSDGSGMRELGRMD